MRTIAFFAPSRIRRARRVFSRPLQGLWLLARPRPDDAATTIPLRGGDLQVPAWKGWRKVLLGALERWGWSCRLEDGVVVVDMAPRELRIRPWDSDRFSFSEVVLNDHYGMRLMDLAGKLVVDVGANVGYSAVVAAMHGARVVCFEAMPETADACRANIEAAGFAGQVELRREAVVGAERSHIDLFQVPGRSWSASAFSGWVEQVERGVPEQVRVPARTIDRILGELPQVDWLKLNVEGAEWDILENVGLEHLARVRRISAGLHDTREPGLHERWSALTSKLRGAGFVVTSQPDPGSVFPEHVALEAVRGAAAVAR